MEKRMFQSEFPYLMQKVLFYVMKDGLITPYDSEGSSKVFGEARKSSKLHSVVPLDYHLIDDENNAEAIYLDDIITKDEFRTLDAAAGEIIEKNNIKPPYMDYENLYFSENLQNSIKSIVNNIDNQKITKIEKEMLNRIMKKKTIDLKVDEIRVDSIDRANAMINSFFNNTNNSDYPNDPCNLKKSKYISNQDILSLGKPTGNSLHLDALPPLGYHAYSILKKMNLLKLNDIDVSEPEKSRWFRPKQETYIIYKKDTKEWTVSYIHKQGIGIYNDKFIPMIKKIFPFMSFAGPFKISYNGGPNLNDFIKHFSKRIMLEKEVSFNPDEKEIQRLKKGKLIITYGTFDAPHKGHLEFFNKAKELGDTLEVIITPDEVVKEMKAGEPLHPVNVRKKVLETLNTIDHVLIGPRGENNNIRLEKLKKVIKEIKPDVYVFGQDQISIPNEFNKKLIEFLEKSEIEHKVISTRTKQHSSEFLERKLQSKT